jgi:hypothetical protein
MLGLGCLCFQTVKRRHETVFLCQDRGTRIIAYRRKSENGGGYRVNFQIDRNATLQEGSKRLSHTATMFFTDETASDHGRVLERSIPHLAAKEPSPSIAAVVLRA